ncbi:MAG: hypothetical protein Q4A71_01960 [Actinomycetaceae bacterium]|nr:hypothetical protein [Actinomycetaceae bacterium]
MNSIENVIPAGSPIWRHLPLVEGEIIATRDGLALWVENTAEATKVSQKLDPEGVREVSDGSCDIGDSTAAYRGDEGDAHACGEGAFFYWHQIAHAAWDPQTEALTVRFQEPSWPTLRFTPTVVDVHIFLDDVREGIEQSHVLTLKRKLSGGGLLIAVALRKKGRLFSYATATRTISEDERELLGSLESLVRNQVGLPAAKSPDEPVFSSENG